MESVVLYDENSKPGGESYGGWSRDFRDRHDLQLRADPETDYLQQHEASLLSQQTVQTLLFPERPEIYQQRIY